MVSDIKLFLWNGEMLNSCDIQLIMGKVFGDDNETLKTPGSPKHKYIDRVYEGLT